MSFAATFTALCMEFRTLKMTDLASFYRICTYLHCNKYTCSFDNGFCFGSEEVPTMFFDMITNVKSKY